MNDAFLELEGQKLLEQSCTVSRAVEGRSTWREQGNIEHIHAINQEDAYLSGADLTEDFDAKQNLGQTNKASR